MAHESHPIDPRSLSSLLRATADRRQIARSLALASGMAGGLAFGSRGVDAASAAAQGETPAQGGTVIFGRAGDADTLDPHHTVASVSWQTFSQIFEPLIAWNMELQYEGILAESWEAAEDGLSYTFKLRSGIKFHDGTDFNADAVKFTFDRLLDPATQAPTLSFISTPDLGLESVEVVDPLTVVMHLKAPFAPFLSNISIATFGIISPAAVEQYGDEFGQNPVGTGPFKFKEWITGESITLERNPDYQNFHSYDTNKGAPYVDEVIFRNLPEEQTMLAAFETGEVNVMGAQAHQVADFESDGSTQLFRATGTDIEFLEFSMGAPEGENAEIFLPPFDDLKVRQATAHAINVEEIIERILEGLAIRNFGPLPSGNAGYNPEIEQAGYHYDVEAANRLLDEAGWLRDGDEGVRQKDGQPLEITFWTWSGGNEERAAQVIQNQLTQVGFDVTLETMEVATFLARLVEPDAPVNLDLSAWGWPEPDLLYLMSTVNAAFGYYRPADYYGLISEARAVPDLTERVAMYYEAMQLMLADAAMIPLWTTISVTAAREEVKGFKLGPMPEILDFQDVYFE